MDRTCHRCHAELSAQLFAGLAGRAAGPSSTSDEERALFCPRCGAPQLLLPDYMRTEPEEQATERTTGAVPPPRPSAIDWPVALQCGAPIALITGLLAALGAALPAASFLNTLCVLSGAGMVLGLYRSRRPLARIDARVGFRLGLLTGVLMIGAMSVCLAGAGLVERFGTHGMASFDAELAHQFSLVETRMAQQAQTAGSGPEALAVQQKMVASLASPEIRAGLGLFYLCVMAAMILFLTTLCGTVSGLLQRRLTGIDRATRN